MLSFLTRLYHFGDTVQVSLRIKHAKNKTFVYRVHVKNGEYLCKTVIIYDLGPCEKLDAARSLFYFR